MEGEKPTKYLCSLEKVVEKHTVITELHVEHQQENCPSITESIKDQATIKAKITSYYSSIYCYRDSEASTARLEQLMKNSPLIKDKSENNVRSLTCKSRKLKLEST